MKYSSWGNLAAQESQIRLVYNMDLNFTDLQDTYLPIGNGRSYGDQGTSRNSQLLDTRPSNKFISLNSEQGTIDIQAGALLREVNEVIMPYGWMLPVMPGTQLITVGGAIANDIHGKNHYQYGSFGSWVDKIELFRSDQGVVECSRLKRSKLFYSTLGGCGLTGVILSARLRIVPFIGSVIEYKNLTFEDVEEFVYLSSSSDEWESSVGWLDINTGRGVFSKGRRIASDFLKMRRNVMFPRWIGPKLVNKISSRIVSNTFWFLESNKTHGFTTDQKYFFPLDRVNRINSIYGKNGFYQYQFVVPIETGIASIKEILKIIKMYGEYSFLTVLKVFGSSKSGGYLSFPMQGLTLAIDFANHGHQTLKMLDDFDRIVDDANGRLYLAKDARMSREFYEKCYVRHTDFLKFRDPSISSDLSRRLMGW